MDEHIRAAREVQRSYINAVKAAIYYKLECTNPTYKRVMENVKKTQDRLLSEQSKGMDFLEMKIEQAEKQLEALECTGAKGARELAWSIVVLKKQLTAFSQCCFEDQLLPDPLDFSDRNEKKPADKAQAQVRSGEPSATNPVATEVTTKDVKEATKQAMKGKMPLSEETAAQPKRAEPKETMEGKRAAPKETAEVKRAAAKEIAEGKRVAPKETEEGKRAATEETDEGKRAAPKEAVEGKGAAHEGTAKGKRAAPKGTAKGKRAAHK